MPEKSRAAYEVVRDESLPEGDWTINFGIVQYAPNLPLEFEFLIGSANTEFFRLKINPDLDNAEVRADVHKASGGVDFSNTRVRVGAGPIQLVQIVYTAQPPRLEAFVNGAPISIKPLAPGAGAAHLPLQFRFYSSYNADEASEIEVAAFTASPGAKREAETMRGLAFAGFPADTRAPWTIATAKRLDERLQTISTTPDNSATTRALAVAARILAERAATGQLSENGWRQLETSIILNTDLDLEALSHLLPLAIAASDVDKNPARQDKAQIWTRRVFEAMPQYNQHLSQTMPILQRAALLDPARAAGYVGDRHLSIFFAQSLAGDLRDVAPMTALAMLRTFERPFPDADSWLLPETNALSPLWGELLEKRLRVYAKQDLRVAGLPDRALSQAAYRIAPTQPEVALEFALLINKPDIKAETLEAMAAIFSAGVLPAEAGSTPNANTVDKAIEAALLETIADWKSSARDDSNVPQRVRLGHWYFERGRKSEAESAFEVAASQIGQLPTTRFRDTWALARLARDMRRTDAATWLEKSASAAIAFDAGADENGPGLYLSATSLVVSDLVKNNEIERALELVAQLEQNGMSNNRDLALATVIFSLSKNPASLPRALQLAETLRVSQQRQSVMAYLAGLLAATDVPRALQLVAELPPQFRVNTAFKMLRNAPPAQAEKLRAMVREAIAAHLKEWQTVKNMAAHEKLEKELAMLSTESLLDLESSFDDDRAFFVETLLQAIARDAGWAQTPLWKRYTAFGGDGEFIPWGLRHLRDAIQSEKMNRERGLE